MPFEADPYRALGLAPGASLNEIRSAYRRLAKTYHPDAAGDRALSRFLAIQAAYERLVDGEGRLRGPRPGPVGKASREAWRAGRGDGGGTGRRARPDDSARPGGRRPGDEPHRRTTRRATPGSTSYDEAAETPLDPAWDGGSWYGPNSGTYWTINPREYADPRKHGPEYLARARRAAGLSEDEPEDQVDDADGPDGPEAVPPIRARAARSATAATSARSATAATSARPAGPSAVTVSTAAIVVAVPVAAVLALGGLPGAGVGDMILIALLALAWVVAFVAALVRLARSRTPPA